MLVTCCSGSASAVLRRENASNGFASWRKRACGHLATPLKVSGMEKGSFEDALAAW